MECTGNSTQTGELMLGAPDKPGAEISHQMAVLYNCLRLMSIFMVHMHIMYSHIHWYFSCEILDLNIK